MTLQLFSILGVQKNGSAYGLAITVTMLMTSILLTEFVRQSGIKPWQAYLVCILLSIEGMFFLSSVIKFVHGGYVVVIISIHFICHVCLA